MSLKFLFICSAQFLWFIIEKATSDFTAVEITFNLKHSSISPDDQNSSNVSRLKESLTNIPGVISTLQELFYAFWIQPINWTCQKSDIDNQMSKSKSGKRPKSFKLHHWLLWGGNFISFVTFIYWTHNESCWFAVKLRVILI